MREEDLYNMQLHDVKVINEELEILKVIGGWIYKHFYKNINDYSFHTTFVPEER